MNDVLTKHGIGIISLPPRNSVSLLNHPTIKVLAKQLQDEGYKVRMVPTLRLAEPYQTLSTILHQETHLNNTAIITDGLLLYGYTEKNLEKLMEITQRSNTKVYILTSIPPPLLKETPVKVIHNEYGNDQTGEARIRTYYGKGTPSDPMIRNIEENIEDDTRIITILAGRHKYAEYISLKLKDYKVIHAKNPQIPPL